jgi:hypothetical protein
MLKRNPIDPRVFGRVGAVLVLLLVGSPLASAEEAPQESVISPYEQDYQDWVAVVGGWTRDGERSLALTLSVGLLGIVSASIQVLQRKSVKVLIAIIGASVSAITFINSTVYKGDYRLYERMAAHGNTKLRKAKKIINVLPSLSAEGRRVGIEELRQLYRELDKLEEEFLKSGNEVASRFSGFSLVATAYAQAAPSTEEAPEWIKGKPSDEENVYIVGTGSHASLETARTEAKANAFESAAKLFAAELPSQQGFDSKAFAEYLAKGAEILETHISYDLKSYHYSVLVGFKRRWIRTDAALFSAQEQVAVPSEVVNAAKGVKGTSDGDAATQQEEKH